MLQDTRSKRGHVTCKVYCKKCCRKEFHFLNIRGSFQRLFVRVLSLGSIGLFGKYRCVCCGTPRIGRFDIIRGRETRDASFGKSSWNPLNWWLERRDSWETVKRRQRFGRLFSRKRGGKNKPFPKAKRKSSRRRDH